MVKNSLARSDGSSSMFQLTGIIHSLKIAQPFSLSRDIYIYLAMTDKIAAKMFYDQLLLSNGDLSDDRENHLSFFKAGFWRTGFLRCSKE